MKVAPELHRLSPTLSLWHAYDSASKTELFSTAFQIDRQTFLVDPISLDQEFAGELVGAGHEAAGVIVTNENHHRAAEDFASRYGVPLFAHREAYAEPKPDSFAAIHSRPGELEIIEIAGAVPGEIALFLPANSGTLIIGDALINFEPYGFTFLPPKYCSNHREMRRSLRQLLDCPAERFCFAHGLPILSKASDRLKALLDS